MSWKNNLQTASFRGITFHVENTSHEFGRRNVVHEFPEADEAYIEDMGRKARVYSITGYVIQTKDNDFDYFQTRDNLISALEESGAGTLVHPFLGSRTVSVTSVRFSESFKDGGMARFDLSFTEGSNEPFVIIKDNSLELLMQLMDEYNAGMDLAFDSFAETYETAITANPSLLSNIGTAINNAMKSVTNVIGGVTTAALSGISAVMQGGSTIIKTAIDIVAAPLSIVANALSVVDTLKESVNTVVDSAVDTAASIRASVEVFPTMADAVSNETNKTLDDAGKSIALAAYKLSKIGEADAPVSIPISTGSELPSNVKNLITDIYKTGAILAAVRSASVINYRSSTEAREMLTTIMDRIAELEEEISTSSGDYNMYAAMQGIKGTFVRLMTVKGAALPDDIEYTVPTDAPPTLAIAYQLYKDITRSDEIVLRNRAVMLHPSFPPAGEVLEVLSA